MCECVRLRGARWKGSSGLKLTLDNDAITESKLSAGRFKKGVAVIRSQLDAGLGGSRKSSGACRVPSVCRPRLGELLQRTHR